MTKSSCIYIGKVIHKRFKPKKHIFQYKVFSLLIDLSELHILEKDINDMVLCGHDVQDLVESHVYDGLKATLQFNTWKRI